MNEPSQVTNDERAVGLTMICRHFCRMNKKSEKVVKVRYSEQTALKATTPRPDK